MTRTRTRAGVLDKGALPPLRSASRQCAQVAQLVEQRIENPRVGSSILSLGTIPITCG
jgi:hypothetical protein